MARRQEIQPKIRQESKEILIKLNISDILSSEMKTKDLSDGGGFFSDRAKNQPPLKNPSYDFLNLASTAKAVRRHFVFKSEL